jgi:hypothetical protein
VCTRVRGVVAVLMIYRVVFSDPRIHFISSFVIVRWCCARTSVARVNLMAARTASMSGFQSSVSVVDLSPSRREKLSSPVNTPKIFHCSLHLEQGKMKCSLHSAASPQSQRFLMLFRYPFSGVMPVRSCAIMLACLLLRSSYMRRVWLPGQAAPILHTDSPNILGACEVALLRRSWGSCTVLLLMLTRSCASSLSSVYRCANCFALCPSPNIGFTGAHAKVTRLLNPSRYLTCFSILLTLACPDFLPRARSVIRTVRLLVNTWIVWTYARGDSAPAYTASTTIPSATSIETSAAVYASIRVLVPTVLSYSRGSLSLLIRSIPSIAPPMPTN